MTTQVMENPLGAFFDKQPELRNKVYQHLAQNSRIWLSGSSSSPNTSEFPWKLASTCKQVYTEFTLFLAATTTLWLYEPSQACLNVTESVSAVYLAYIKTVCITGNTMIFIKFKKMPMLESVQFVFGPIEWRAFSQEVVTSAFSGIDRNTGLLDFSRRFVRHQLASSAAFLDSLAVPGHVNLVVSVVVTARLPSKVNFWGEVAGRLGRSLDHYDAIFELNYNWRTGEILGGLDELIRARARLLSLFALEEEHQVMLERLQEPENETEDQIEEMQWRTEDWHERQGEMFIAEGRDWVFRGVVMEKEGEVGPGKM